MPFSDKQQEFFRNANHRWNIKVGATRSGKTYMDYYVIPKRIRARREKEGLVAILGVSKGTIQRNIVEPLQRIWGTKLVGDIKVEIGNLVYDTTDTTKLNSYDVTYTMPGATSSSIKVTVPTEANRAEIPVLNKAGSTLPSTGGMGTVVFTIAGAAIIGLMLVSSLVSKKRKRSE